MVSATDKVHEIIKPGTEKSDIIDFKISVGWFVEKSRLNGVVVAVVHEN